MKKLLLLAAILISIWLILKLHLLEALFSLLFIGLVPGTNLSIPAPFMLLAYGAIGYIGLLTLLKRQPVTSAAPAASSKPNKITAKAKTNSRKSTKRPVASKRKPSKKR